MIWGLGLYRREPVFRETLDRCAELLQPIIDEDIKRVIFAEKGKYSASVGQPVDMRKMLSRDKNDEADKKLHQNTMIHPIMVALEYALASLWLDKGIKLQSMIGYSLGEYTAACLSGVLSLKDVLTLVSHRSRLIDRLPEGGMIAVMSSVEDVIPLLSPDIFLAITSGPFHSVISGDPGALSQLERRITEKNIAYVRLPNSHAIHTTTAQSIGGDLLKLLQSIQLNPPKIPYISNVTGNWITREETTDPYYWIRHTCGTVLFGQGLGRLLEDPSRVLIEAGPGQSLSSFVLQHPTFQANRHITTISSLRNRQDNEDDNSFFLKSLGMLWLAGLEIKMGEP